MGWASGSSLMSGIIQDMHSIDEDTRVEVYKTLILNFEEFDCDTLDECLGEDTAYDRAWKLVGNEIENDEDYTGYDDLDEIEYDE